MTSSISSLLMVVGMWLALALLCCGGDRRFSPTPKTDIGPPMAVAAPVLVADYEANEVAADRKYKGQILEITGIVDSIGKDILDSMYVTLDSGEQFGITSVRCFFDESEENYLAALSKGRSLTVKGRCDGKFGNVLIKECEIVRVGN